MPRNRDKEVASFGRQSAHDRLDNLAPSLLNTACFHTTIDDRDLADVAGSATTKFAEKHDIRGDDRTKLRQEQVDMANKHIALENELAELKKQKRITINAIIELSKTQSKTTKEIRAKK